MIQFQGRKKKEREEKKHGKRKEKKNTGVEIKIYWIIYMEQKENDFLNHVFHSIL